VSWTLCWLSWTRPPEADKILNDRGIVVVPDILVSAGGAIVSYFEWVQDLAFSRKNKRPTLGKASALRLQLLTLRAYHWRQFAH